MRMTEPQRMLVPCAPRRLGGLKGGYRQEGRCGLKRRGWKVEMGM